MQEGYKPEKIREAVEKVLARPDLPELILPTGRAKGKYHVVFDLNRQEDLFYARYEPFDVEGVSDVDVHDVDELNAGLNTDAGINEILTCLNGNGLSHAKKRPGAIPAEWFDPGKMFPKGTHYRKQVSRFLKKKSFKLVLGNQGLLLSVDDPKLLDSLEMEVHASPSGIVRCLGEDYARNIFMLSVMEWVNHTRYENPTLWIADYPLQFLSSMIEGERFRKKNISEENLNFLRDVRKAEVNKEAVKEEIEMLIGQNERLRQLPSNTAKLVSDESRSPKYWEMRQTLERMLEAHPDSAYCRLFGVLTYHSLQNYEGFQKFFPLTPQLAASLPDEEDKRVLGVELAEYERLYNNAIIIGRKKETARASLPMHLQFEEDSIFFGYLNNYKRDIATEAARNGMLERKKAGHDKFRDLELYGGPLRFVYIPSTYEAIQSRIVKLAIDLYLKKE